MISVLCSDIEAHLVPMACYLMWCLKASCTHQNGRRAWHWCCREQGSGAPSHSLQVPALCLLGFSIPWACCAPQGAAAVCRIYRPAPAPPAQPCPCCSLLLGMATMHHTSLLHIELDFSWGILSRCKLGQSCCSTLHTTDLIIQPPPHSKNLPPPDELTTCFWEACLG